MYNQKIFNNNTCFISGSHRSGKSLLTAIIPSIEKSGLINKEPLLNLVPNMYANKEINLKSAKYLARFIQSNTNYSNFIGRKLNLKKTDETSIYNHMNYKKYLDKISSKTKIKIQENTVEKEVSFYDIHNILTNLKFWKQTNDNFKLINIDRNPIDLVYSWHENGFGSYSDSSINQLLLYKEKNVLIPSYAKKWKSKFLKMNELDRIIEILNQQIIAANNNYRYYQKNTKILRIKYEDMLVNPLNNLQVINNFLNLKSKIYFSKYKDKVINKKYSLSAAREKKLKFIEGKCSKNYFSKLIKLEKFYNL